MKNLSYLILLFIVYLSAQIAKADVAPLDTIYYDKDWKGVNGPHFATYYRVIEVNPDSNCQKKFRDYYLTGELQSEGGYITLDRYDDSKSVMDGEYITYYKSGAIQNKGKRMYGKREGEHFYFHENGSIIERAYFSNDQFHGLYTKFGDDGLCYQMEYWNGNPKYDYYIVTNDNGLYSKLNLKDNTPIYTSPSVSDKKVEYIDGEAWPYYIHDGLMVAMTNTRTNDYGKYYRVYVNITNNSFFSIEFDPTESTAVLTDRKGIEKELEIQSAQQYDKRIRRTQMWEEALVGFANGMAASNAGYSTSTTITNYSGSSYSSGRGSAYGSGGYAFGTYSGSSNYYGSSISTTRTYDAGAAYQAQLAASKQMAAFSESNFQVRQARNEGYLKRTTINPGESIKGYFNIKRKDGESLNITLNISGTQYEFLWNVKK